MDAARNYLFPIYASLLTPWWLRLLGAKVGRGTEISTALLIPKFTVVEDGAFLADDTMVASYELGGGWLRIAEARVGKRAFLGNSGMTAPGRSVPKNGLVAVLSAGSLSGSRPAIVAVLVIVWPISAQPTRVGGAPLRGGCERQAARAGP